VVARGDSPSGEGAMTSSSPASTTYMKSPASPAWYTSDPGSIFASSLLGVQGAGCWVLGVGCRVLGVGCWVLGVGCWVLDVCAGFWVWAPGFRGVWSVGYRSSGFGLRVLGLGVGVSNMRFWGHMSFTAARSSRRSHPWNKAWRSSTSSSRPRRSSPSGGGPSGCCLRLSVRCP